MQTGKWTVEQAREVVALYDGGNGMSVPDISEQTGRSTRSIQGKLTSEKVYVKPEKPAARPKDEGPTKAEILTALNKHGIDTTGGENATKAFLTRLLGSV